MDFALLSSEKLEKIENPGETPKSVKFQLFFELRGVIRELEKKVPPGFNLFFNAFSYSVHRSGRKCLLSAQNRDLGFTAG